MSSHTTRAARDRAVIRALKQNKTCRQVAKEFGISKSRVAQLAKENNLGVYGKRALLAKQKAVAAKRKAEVFFTKYGIPIERKHELRTPEGRWKLNAIKTMRRTRDIPLRVSIRFCDLETPTHCPVLGIKLCYTNKGIRKANSPSVDRLIPKKGYVKSNVAVISWRANKIKSDATAEELRKIYEWVTP